MARASLWNRNPLAFACFVTLLITLALLLTRGQDQTERLWSNDNRKIIPSPGTHSRSKDPSGKGIIGNIRPNTYGHLVVSQDYTGPHPIEALLEEAEIKAEAIEHKNKGIKYLRDAVADYEKAFGMPPPRGFEKW
jgi:hypothetical protein